MTDSSEYQPRFRYVHDVEDLDLYQPGGYHPVILDDLIHERYRIIDKLGHGGYSTIWLAQDIKVQRYVAVKVGVSSSRQLLHEPAIFRELSPKTCTTEASPLPVSSTPEVLDEFTVEGPNGLHSCLVTHPAQGSLAQAQGYGRPFPIHVARGLAAMLIQAIAHVHSQGFVHGDITLSNILIGLASDFNCLSIAEVRARHGEPQVEPVVRLDGKPLTPNQPTEVVIPVYLGKSANEFNVSDAHRLLLTDFGESFAPEREARLGEHSHIPFAFRSPEAFFEPKSPLSYPSDIWSLATAIWQILGIKSMFSKESLDRDEVVAEQIDTLGTDGFPSSWYDLWSRGTAEQESGSMSTVPRRPTFDREPWLSLDELLDDCILEPRSRRSTLGTLEHAEGLALLAMMRDMLRFRPEKRLTIAQVLQSDWVTEWAMPALYSQDAKDKRTRASLEWLVKTFRIG